MDSHSRTIRLQSRDCSYDKPSPSSPVVGTSSGGHARLLQVPIDMRLCVRCQHPLSDMDSHSKVTCAGALNDLFGIESNFSAASQAEVSGCSNPPRPYFSTLASFGSTAAAMNRLTLLPALVLVTLFNTAQAERNYSDNVYNICVNPWEPIMSCNPSSNTFQGLDIQEFDEIGDNLGWKRVEPGQKSCGKDQQCYRYKCLTLQDLEKDLVDPNGECHMGTSLTVSNERIDAGMTFSFPIFRGRVEVLTKAEYTRGNGWGFTRPVTWDVWLTVLLTGLLLVPGLLVLFEYISEQETFPRSLGDVAGGMSEAWWNSMTTLLQMDAASVRSAEAKVIMVAYAFLVLIIVTSYAANMTSNLTVTKITANVESPADLNGKSVGTLKVYKPRLDKCVAVLAVYVVDTVKACLCCSPSVYRTNLAVINANSSTMEVALNMLMNDEVDALAMSSHWISAVLKWRGCKNDLFSFPLHVEPFDYALIFPGNIPSDLLFLINKVIMKMSSGVELQQIANIFQAENRCRERHDVDPLTVFGMHHVYGVWVLMAGAVFLACMISLTRCMLKRYNLYHPRFDEFKDNMEDITMENSAVKPSSSVEAQKDGKEYQVLLEIQKKIREMSENMGSPQQVKPICTKQDGAGESQNLVPSPVAPTEISKTDHTIRIPPEQ